MIDRVMGVLRADVNTFEEIEHDQNATMQAAIVVGVVGLVGAIGAVVFAQQAADLLSNVEGLEQLPGFAQSMAEVSTVGVFVQTLAGAFISWAVWSWVAMFVGTSFFGGKADMGEMLRVLGFARAPGVLSVFPCLGIIGWIWSLYLGYVAVRQGLDIDGGKAFLTIIISAIPVWIVSAVLGSVIGVIF